MRQVNQIHPPPPVVFPITPPGTAGLENLISRNEEDESLRGSLWTTMRSPPITPVKREPDLESPRRSGARSWTRHRRAYSYSTVDNNHDVGAFKVVIERPRLDGRPRTAENADTIPTLQVPIPSYKLGIPRFSARGTAFFRGSSYTATEEMSPSEISGDASQIDRATIQLRRILSRRQSHNSQEYQQSATPASPTETASLPSSSMIPPHITIEPAMFDSLTFKPDCDHRSIVRYSIATGAITAATPPRLVAEITSPSFLDYDLLSDFFLTFRSFLPTSDLLAMLVARLRWALDRDDETGMVVRVRTFVALRHWILNYFMDDFVLDYDLRKTFCELINGFVDEVLQTPGKKNRLKILGELKKCYRRVCSIYWDGPEFSVDLGPEVPIPIGGVTGSRLSYLTPSFWLEPEQEVGLLQLSDGLDHDACAEPGYNFFADVSKAGHIESAFVDSRTPLAGAIGQGSQPDPPLSPKSILSEDAVSCSFPSRFKAAQPGTHRPLGAHPVSSSSKYDSPPPIAYTPKAFTGKRSRPAHAHKRSGSFSDSLRDKRKPVCTVVYKDTEVQMALPNYGSLVRGGVIPPGQALVEALAPGTPSAVDRGTTYFMDVPSYQKGTSVMTSAGMKRLIGGLRRAISTKTGGITALSSTGPLPQISSIGARGFVACRPPRATAAPQGSQGESEGRVQIRIDILGAGIVEDFKNAVQADAAADAHRDEQNNSPSIGIASDDQTMHPSVRPDVNEYPVKPSVPRTITSGLTNGSKSIVIVDDTLPLDRPIFTSALPINTSIGALAQTYERPPIGLTPPSTPPGRAIGSPRRLSQALSENAYPDDRSLFLERTPSLVHDICSPLERSPSPHLRDHTSVRSIRRSCKSIKPVSLRRYASYQSGITRNTAGRSFDATTLSGSGGCMSDLPLAPGPLRVLRRRPGGDLRAVANIGSLPQRPRSAGSLATYSESAGSSYLAGGHSTRDSHDYIEVVNSDFPQSNIATFSLGALAENRKRDVSLFSTHSSQPVMRPSFEAEAAKLAQIPDDDDDGGVESALLKLEGKFEQRRSDTSTGLVHGAPASPPQSCDIATEDSAENPENEKRSHRHRHLVERTMTKTAQLPGSYHPEDANLRYGMDTLKQTAYRPHQAEDTSQPNQPEIIEQPYMSLPLLQRPDSYDEVERDSSRDWTETSILRGPSSERKQYRKHSPESSHPSFDFIDDSESFKRIPIDGAFLGHESADHSFLESESDHESDLSSELSIEVISRKEYAGEGSATTFPPTRSGTVIKEIALPSHPLRLPSSHPSSPSITLGQALSLTPDAGQVPQVDAYQLQQWNKPAAIYSDEGGKGSWEQDGQLDHLEASSNKVSTSSRSNSIHLPFILAFDSKVLAQQFTLIEKDALNEIDWKELIDMRWKSASTAPRSWVHFLRTQKPRGVEVVIARFNIMVKWAVSECVLTQNLEERVQTIIKYIHIAAHCRRYRNFATMYQLTVALTSNDIARLNKTWQYVPAADIRTLKELEALVQPTRNFYNLRAEMEGAGGDRGCIPFVGIYTHDLLFNSQRPSQIASTPTTEPLVNFERCRTTATIIKNLLRLLEASTLYRFQPIEGITERCLWMAALSDEEIRKYGSTIE